MRGLLSKCALAAASVAAALLFTECGLALLDPQDLSVWTHTRDGLVVHPASIETYLPRFGQTVRTNAWGMRDGEHSLQKPEGSFRILLLGDSFMEALQVAYEESLPSLLGTALTERVGRTVEVVNAGTSGWGTDDEVAYLDRYGRRFHPDLVLVAMTLHNDVSDNLAFEHHELRDGRIVPRPPQEPGAFEWAFIRTRDFIATRSQLYAIYRRFKASRRAHEAALLNDHVAALVQDRDDPRTELGWEVTRQLLERAQRIAEGEGAKLAVFTIPLFIQVSPEHLEDFLSLQHLDPRRLDLDRPQRVVAEWGAKRGVEVIDLLPEFRAASRRGRSLYLVRDGHWNREGHALAAEGVARELVRRGLVHAGSGTSP